MNGIKYFLATTSLRAWVGLPKPSFFIRAYLAISHALWT